MTVKEARENDNSFFLASSLINSGTHRCKLEFQSHSQPYLSHMLHFSWIVKASTIISLYNPAYHGLILYYVLYIFNR